MQYVLIRDREVQDTYDGYSTRFTDYLCTGTITEVLSAINEDIKIHYKNIKADTFQVKTFDCVRVLCDVDTEYVDCDFESVSWIIIPTNKTNISIW